MYLFPGGYVSFTVFFDDPGFLRIQTTSRLSLGDLHQDGTGRHKECPLHGALKGRVLKGDGTLRSRQNFKHKIP